METIKSVDGRLLHLGYHQKRYESVLKSFGIYTFHNLCEYLKPPSDGIYKCRLIYNENIVDISYTLYIKKQIKSLKLIYDNKIEYFHKSTSREVINELFEKKQNCDDILIVKNNLVCDTSIANIALFKDGIWFTPSKPLLNGTTRQRLLDEGRLQETNIKVDDLKDYTKLALLNAMIDFDIIQKYNLKDIIC
ncbi:aminotransferase class IV [Sulfurimonas sp.]|uniref:aminotransferase class IV n=1 Tax=Sulfurimonas sp. TaxID=2022749 RepID=UPI002AB2AFBF|nr:aminotransferase class IV [Sulfurimonas sp.]